MQRQVFLSSCLATVALGARPMIAAAAESAYDLVTPSGTIFGTLVTPAGSPADPGRSHHRRVGTDRSRRKRPDAEARHLP